MLYHQILLVEDDEEDRALLQEAFEKAGYRGELKFVHSGEAAVKYLQSVSPSFYPSLIVLDFNIPGLNGTETLAQVKKLEPPGGLPVVFYSRGMRPLVKELLLAAGAAACLEKREDTGSLGEVIQSFLALVHQSARLRTNS